MKGEGKMRTIRKYKNRKLYCLEKSKYITQKELIPMIIRNEDFKVELAGTGEDITLKTKLRLFKDCPMLVEIYNKMEENRANS